jgi:hypothetical protein
MDYVFHSGDPIANDAVRIASDKLQQFLELAGYSLSEQGDELNATEFFFRMTGAQSQFEVGSEMWNKAEDLLTVAQNASAAVFYTPSA